MTIIYTQKFSAGFVEGTNLYDCSSAAHWPPAKYEMQFAFMEQQNSVQHVSSLLLCFDCRIDVSKDAAVSVLLVSILSLPTSPLLVLLNPKDVKTKIRGMSVSFLPVVTAWDPKRLIFSSTAVRTFNVRICYSYEGKKLPVLVIVRCSDQLMAQTSFFL